MNKSILECFEHYKNFAKIMFDDFSCDVTRNPVITIEDNIVKISYDSALTFIDLNKVKRISFAKSIN